MTDKRDQDFKIFRFFWNRHYHWQKKSLRLRASLYNFWPWFFYYLYHAACFVIVVAVTPFPRRKRYHWLGHD